MTCGLYGKVRSKRDFIALAVPREFLEVWEPWLQTSVSTSQHHLSHRWRDAFLSAPIWRFWLGAELCGRTVAGAIMPSLDGIGRYFPLTLAARSGEGTAIPPPELDGMEAWFEAAESLLLGALDQDRTFEALAAALERMPDPRFEPASPRMDGVTDIDGNTFAVALDRGRLAETLSAARVAAHSVAYASATFWWTSGGQDYPPLALLSRRLPDPALFAGMLTGRFEGAGR